MATYKSIYELKEFLVLWASQAFSTLGSAMTNYALILWAYGERGTVSSITLLSVFSYLPSILFCFAAGTLADRWNKKKIMLASDALAALATLIVAALYLTSALAVWHLYLVNFVLSLMNAFQGPASYVAVSLLAPRAQYSRVAALQALSSSLVTVLAPVLATAVMSFGGLAAVLAFDLGAFLLAFTVLLVFIKIPAIKPGGEKPPESFWQNCLAGLRFLRQRPVLLRIIMFFSFINLLASLAGNSVLPAMILARTGGDRQLLGIVTSCIGLGTLVGSLLAAVKKETKNKTRVIFLSCALSFMLCDILWGLGRSAPVWIFAAFAGNLPLPFLNANLTTIMRTKVPIDMQGRVFATRDTLQYCTIPLGLFFAGVLGDTVFEPFMAGTSPLAAVLARLAGGGAGAGLAVMFLCTGVVGTAVCLISLVDKRYRVLDEPEPEPAPDNPKTGGILTFETKETI